MHKKQVNIVSNYQIIAGSTEAIATFLKRKLKSFGSIGQYIDNTGNIKKKYHKMLCDFFREESNMHLLSLSGLRVFKGHNIVPVVLRETIAEMFAGNSVTPTLEANYMALGSGNTPTSNSDTTLDTEVIRQTFTNRFAVSNVAYLDKFFNSDDVGGSTYLEAGVFVDGTASADTGYLLSRIIIDETLSGSESLTMNVSITVS